MIWSLFTSSYYFAHLPGWRAPPMKKRRQHHDAAGVFSPLLLYAPLAVRAAPPPTHRHRWPSPCLLAPAGCLSSHSTHIFLRAQKRTGGYAPPLHIKAPEQVSWWKVAFSPSALPLTSCWGWASEEQMLSDGCFFWQCVKPLLHFCCAGVKSFSYRHQI